MLVLALRMLLLELDPPLVRACCTLERAVDEHAKDRVSSNGKASLEPGETASPGDCARPADCKRGTSSHRRSVHPFFARTRSTSSRPLLSCAPAFRARAAAFSSHMLTAENG